MTAQLIDGNALSRQLRTEVAHRAAALKARGVTPGGAVNLSIVDQGQIRVAARPGHISENVAAPMQAEVAVGGHSQRVFCRPDKV